jgi:hypothetical protein
MKMEKGAMLKLFQEWGRGGQRRMMEGVNWTMIYCKNNNMIKTEKNTSSKLNKMDLFIETIKEKTHVNQHG